MAIFIIEKNEEFCYDLVGVVIEDSDVQDGQIVIPPEYSGLKEDYTLPIAAESGDILHLPKIKNDG